MSGIASAETPQFALSGSVSVSSQLTAVDPYANPAKPNALNPSRPYWYSADASGLTTLKLTDNTPLGTVAWPTADIPLALPDGETMMISAPAAGWQPVGLMVPYPSLEAIGPEAVAGGETLAFVEMKYSGYEWQSSNGRDRDMIVPAAGEATDASILLNFDVTDPAAPVLASAALLGYHAGQMAWEPAAGAVFVGNEPETSLPAGLQAFISKITPPEIGAEPPPPFAPETLYPLCGPEVQWSGEVKTEDKTGIPVNVPEAWICDTLHGAGAGEGPFTYTYEGLPTWLTATSDGLIYGTPPEVGVFKFVVHTADAAAGPDDLQTASAVVTLDVKPSVTEFVGGEWEGGEAGVLGALAFQGAGDPATLCQTAPGQTEKPGWVHMETVPNGCVIWGTPTISGEYYDFTMPNFHWDVPYAPGNGIPWNRAPYDPVMWTGVVLGTYGFDALPDTASIAGLAYHEVDMIPGEPDKYNLNGEFIGITPGGQLYADVVPYEQSDTIEEVGPPATVVDQDEVSALGTPLSGSGFGNLVMQGNGDIFVAAAGAVIKVPDTVTVADVADNVQVPELEVTNTLGEASTIEVPGIAAAQLALDSNLAPAVKPDLGGPGQIDYGALLVTSPSSGELKVIETATGAVTQTLPIADTLGGLSIDSAATGLAFVAAGASVAVPGSTVHQAAPQLATINPAEAIIDPTVWTQGQAGSMNIVSTGWPIPTLSVPNLPAGVTLTDRGDGSVTLSGDTTVAPGVYNLTATATNGVGTDAVQAFTLTVEALAAPTIMSAAETTLLPNVAGVFQVQASGVPTPELVVEGQLPAGMFFQDNNSCSPLPEGQDAGTNTGPDCTGSAFLGGIPAVDSGVYNLTITATNSQGTVTQAFTLNISGTLNPVITSADTATFRAQSMGSFTVTATGSPVPTLSESGTLPSGVSFKDNGNGTATLAGKAATQGSYDLKIKAANGKGPDAVQNFTLVVERAPAATTELLTTTGLPEPSESLAIDLQTGTVYAMTGDVEYEGTGEIESGALANTNGAAPTLTVLDNLGNVIASIPVTRDAEYMAVNSTTSRLYVPQWDRSRETDPNGTDNQGLTIINTKTNTLVTTIKMPKPDFSAFRFYPVGVAVDEASNVVYVGATTAEAEAAEEAGGDQAELRGYILAFDGKDNKYLGYVRAGKDPESLVFNPTAKKVYAANEDDGNLTIVPAITRYRSGWSTALPWSAQKPIQTPKLFPDTCAWSDEGRTFGQADKMVVDPVTNKVYVTDDAYRVAQINGSDDSVKVLTIDANCGTPNSANNLALAANRGAKVGGVRQGILYVTTEGNRVTVVDLSKFKVAGSMQVVGAHHLGWPVISSNNRLFVTDEDSPAVSVFELKDGLTP